MIDPEVRKAAASATDRRLPADGQQLTDPARLRRLRLLLAALEQRAHFVSEEIAREMERLGIRV